MMNRASLPGKLIQAWIALALFCLSFAACRLDGSAAGDPGAVAAPASTPDPEGGDAPSQSPDPIPGPRISGLGFNVLHDSARIEWATDIACACRVDYGPTTAYGTSLSPSGSATAHSVELTALDPDRVYYFRVTAIGPDESDAWADSLRTALVSGGLHAASVVDLGGGFFRYVYDWSDDAQLLDWTPTAGASITRDAGRAAVSGGATPIRGMAWRKTIACSRLAAVARTAGDHINVYTNLGSTWNGDPWDPNPAIGAISRNGETLWVLDGSTSAVTGAPGVVANADYEIELAVNASQMVWTRGTGAGAQSYPRAGSYAPATTGRIALGAYQSATSWGSLVIEGRPEGAGLSEAPTIMGVSAVTDTVTTISWSTDIPSSSLVEYGTDPKALTGAVRSEELAYAHALTVEGLQPGTVYWYRVSSRADSGSSTSRPYSYLPGGDSHPDEIVFKARGAGFEAIIEVDAGANVLWTFADGTTSSSLHPDKDYGSAATRLNRLRVTPWSAIRLIDIGYDGGDGGTAGRPGYLSSDYFLDQQDVTAVYGMRNAASSLRAWASSHNPITSMDFHGFTALEVLEAYLCRSNREIDLRDTPALRRLCLEDNDLIALDLSGCPSLEDLRGAQNAYTSIAWGDSGEHVWHICVRDNPQITQPHPAFSQFPALDELFIWNNNQDGVLEMTAAGNPLIREVLANDNHYASANLGGIFPAGRRGNVELSRNRLSSLNVSDNPGLYRLEARANLFDQAAIDGILEAVDGFGTSDGVLDLGQNAAPSAGGLASAEALRGRGWTVTVDE